MPEAVGAGVVTTRELDARMEEIRRAVDIALQTSGSHVELREYVEALFNEQTRAIEIAERERSKAADALFSESRRASEIAEGEREKSASALREGMRRSIEEGDDRLREHIQNQIQQIQAALISADSLEVERIDLVKTEIGNLDSKVAGLFEEKQKALDSALIAQKEAVAKAEIATDRIAARGQIDQEALRADMQERLAAVRRELEQATAAQKEAVLKAEAANQKVFDGQNEWRAQSADRERSSQETMQRLTGTYMPREVADTQFKELRERFNLLQNTVLSGQAKLEGRQGEHIESRSETSADRAEKSLQAQIKSVYIAMIGIALSGGALVVTAVATHGFR